MSFTDFLFNTFSGALETVGESKLMELLQTLHDKDQTQYKAAIYGGQAMVQLLEPLVDKSKTNIDNAIVGALGEALRLSAVANGLDINNPDAGTPALEDPNVNANQ